MSESPSKLEGLFYFSGMHKQPESLRKGDKVGVVAPSRVITEMQMEKAFEIFGSWGLEVIRGDALFAKAGYFAGTDSERREDLQRMLDDPDIKAIFCARGGYGMTRVIDQLDLSNIVSKPKWVIGFSDITALHLALNRKKVESIHGLMPVQYNYMGVEQSLSSLRQLLFEGMVDYEIAFNAKNKQGACTAEIVGGNLSLVVESLGTPTEIDTDKKILILEEIDEYLYKIDRMFMQLSRSGKLRNLAGVIVGDFSQMKDTQIPFGKSVLDLIAAHLEELDIPVAYNFPVGHEARNLAIPLGRKMHLEVLKDTVRLRDAV
ncbi:LD-carboxypeptidase [Fulvivirga ulvae]|uniref:S66 peptidase family protein n=1 Tax=Fulvivirga ulvae TaxID=2904245 RepID=UPI001F23B1F5|nr:LD-carboxypeptidase [Fulvivirga ulvae]UII34434.1 LD-carboxypeptidase [Fulvivirga ulvae]